MIPTSKKAMDIDSDLVLISECHGAPNWKLLKLLFTNKHGNETTTPPSPHQHLQKKFLH